MAFLFETRTLASIASSPEAAPTSAMTTPSPTPYPSDILTDAELTRSDRSLDLSFDNSSSALQEVGLIGQQLTTNDLIYPISQSQIFADVETLKVNINQLFLLVNGSLVILMQVLIANPDSSKCFSLVLCAVIVQIVLCR